MRVGFVIPTYDQYGNPDAFRRLAVEGELLGYDSAWFGDHIIVPDYATGEVDPHWYEAMTSATYGLGITQRLKFGMDVLVAPYRNPILLAKMAATAAELSGGRLLLGFGVGWLRGEFEALGGPPYSKRGKSTDEYLRVIRALFEAEGPVSYQGEWVRFENVHFGPKQDPEPPLLVGGNHDLAIERAARLGDGWHPLFISDAAYAKGRAKIEKIRATEGLTRPYIYSYSCSQTRLLSPGEPAPPPFQRPTEDVPVDFDYVPPFPMAPDGRQRFIGTAAQLREDIEVFAAAGVEQIVLRFALPRDPQITLERYLEQLRLFARDVLPTCARL